MIYLMLGILMLTVITLAMLIAWADSDSKTVRTNYEKDAL